MGKKGNKGGKGAEKKRDPSQMGEIKHDKQGKMIDDRNTALRQASCWATRTLSGQTCPLRSFTESSVFVPRLSLR